MASIKRQIVFVDEKDQSINGYTKDGVIYINKNGRQPVASTFSHELTHNLEQAKAYQPLQEHILSRLQEDGTDIDAEIAAKMELYAKHDRALTAEEARQEIVADYAGQKLFSSEADVMRLVRSDMNLGQKIHAYIRDMITMVRGTDAEKFLVRAERLYRKALKEAGKSGKAETVAQYSLDTKGILNSLERYSDKEIQNINSHRIKIMQKEGDFHNFINEALSAQGGTPKVKMFLGKISEELGEKIYNSTNIDIRGYNIAISNHEIQKVLKNSHGDQIKESLRGQRAVNASDIFNLLFVVSSPDSIYLSSKPTDQGKPAIIFEKKIEDKFVYVQYVSDKHYTLDGKTLWIVHKKKSPLPATDSNSSPLSTSETNSGKALFSDTNVPQDGAGVKDSVRGGKPKYSVSGGGGDQKSIDLRVLLGGNKKAIASDDRQPQKVTEKNRFDDLGHTQAWTAGDSKEYVSWAKAVSPNAIGLPKTIDAYLKIKYTDSKEYGLIQGYTRAVQSGDISPLVGYNIYKSTAKEIESNLVGMTTSKGLKIKGYSYHFIDRVIGQVAAPHRGKREGVSVADVKKALMEPIKVNSVVIDKMGRKSTLYSGQKCKVSINPDTGEIIQTNPRK